MAFATHVCSLFCHGQCMTTVAALRCSKYGVFATIRYTGFEMGFRFVCLTLATILKFLRLLLEIHDSRLPQHSLAVNWWWVCLVFPLFELKSLPCHYRMSSWWQIQIGTDIFFWYWSLRSFFCFQFRLSNHRPRSRRTSPSRRTKRKRWSGRRLTIRWLKWLGHRPWDKMDIWDIWAEKYTKICIPKYTYRNTPHQPNMHTNIHAYMHTCIDAHGTNMIRTRFQMINNLFSRFVF